MTKSKAFRKTLLYIISTAFIGFLVNCSIFFIINPLQPRYLDCGKVVSKSSDEVPIKHGTETELYLNVNFEKTGFKSVKCEPTDYFNYKVGENICFNLRQGVSLWYAIRMFAGILFIVVVGFIIVIAFIMYLFGEFENSDDD